MYDFVWDKDSYQTFVPDKICDIIVDVRNLEWDAILKLINGFNVYHGPKGSDFRRLTKNVQLHCFASGKPHWITAEFNKFYSFLVDGYASATCMFRSYVSSGHCDKKECETAVCITIGIYNSVRLLRYERPYSAPPKRYD